ncbi:MAG: DUF6754 domain-containing protein [Candidatus Eisenbacteria bacterium]
MPGRDRVHNLARRMARMWDIGRPQGRARSPELLWRSVATLRRLSRLSLLSLPPLPLLLTVSLLAVSFAVPFTVPFAFAQAPASPDSASSPAASAVRPQPPGDLRVLDQPNDNGHGVVAQWSLSPDDASLLGYQIYRASSADSPEADWFPVGTAARGTTTYTYHDKEKSFEGKPNRLFVAVGQPVHLKVRALGAGGEVSAFTSPATGVPRGNWFHKGKLVIAIAVLLFGAAVVYYIASARKGKELYVRPIPGLGAVDEAIGRATEMGKPILFVLGTGTAGDIATIAGYTILARVAKRTAEYQTPILVPVNDPVMMAMGQEVVREAYLQAGRPEVYRPENVFYISAMQFPYVAAVNGLMLREKTATNFYMGVFAAESLLLAEAGSATGSIQISGTDQVPQIPFFVAATDYTLIGEELYAASAYLSQEPSLLGPLKAQDYTKIVIILVILSGVLALSLFHWDGIVRLVTTSV